MCITAAMRSESVTDFASSGKCRIGIERDGGPRAEGEHG